jgi:hypothetical protein
MAAWRYITDPANAATVQALSAVAVVILTVSVVLFMKRQTRILRLQVDLQDRQARIESTLASLEYAPIVAAEFSGDYDSTANRILLKNGGRGPAHNIRGHLWAGTEAQQWEASELQVRPTNLSAGDFGEAEVQLEHLVGVREKLGDPFRGLGARINDIWVLHYGDALGRTWHTTCNIGDRGRHAPLRYFRSWSPDHWSALPQDTRERCWICLEDENLKAAADRAYGEQSSQTSDSA